MIINPYTILGISRDSSDEEVKKAYRNLSRKYHPDANINNPNKEQAEEKFKEIQQAYQMIMNEREKKENYSGSYGNSGGYEEFGGFGSYGGFNSRQAGAREDDYTMHLQAAQNYINSRHFAEAVNVLDSMGERTGVWYYLSAIANMGVGNNIQAMEYAKKAVELEPNNLEYRMLLGQMQSGGTWYTTMQSPYGGDRYMCGDWCMKLCIANAICNVCCLGRC